MVLDSMNGFARQLERVVRLDELNRQVIYGEVAQVFPVAAVAFVGFQNQSALPAYLAAAEAIVLPSDAGETWGLVVNEALACGLPAVVSSAAGCAPDLIDDGETGFRFDLGNVEQITAAICSLADATDARRRRMAEAIAAKSARYSCGAAVQGVVDALDRVAPAPSLQ